MNTFSNNPSEYEGRILKENQELKEHLKWCLYYLEGYPLETSHDGPCSPPATCCDGACMESYYFYKRIIEIEKLLIKTEV